MAQAVKDFLIDSDELSTARWVLEQEVKGIQALSKSLGQPFIDVIDLLASIPSHQGRVVVTGMGKSGHVGRKLAATLASTGLPAFFVHPGEASHGDLGMLTKHDVLIALSNSGETDELRSILAYSCRFSIPLIAITSKAQSTLAKAAKIALVLPEVPEACPNGLTPTTSATMMMVLGDGLAITLLQRRGFAAEDYRILHPGGNLGRRLLRVKDLMHGKETLPLVGEKALMDDALLVMTEKSFGCVGVIDSAGKLLGLITDGDLRRHMEPQLIKQLVTKIMTKNPKTITSDILALEATQRMSERSITSLFVVDDSGKPEGLIHVHDCLRSGLV